MWRGGDEDAANRTRTAGLPSASRHRRSLGPPVNDVVQAMTAAANTNGSSTSSDVGYQPSFGGRTHRASITSSSTVSTPDNGVRELEDVNEALERRVRLGSKKSAVASNEGGDAFGLGSAPRPRQPANPQLRSHALDFSLTPSQPRWAAETSSKPSHHQSRKSSLGLSYGPVIPSREVDRTRNGPQTTVTRRPPQAAAANLNLGSSLVSGAPRRNSLIGRAVGNGERNALATSKHPAPNTLALHNWTHWYPGNGDQRYDGSDDEQGHESASSSRRNSGLAPLPDVDDYGPPSHVAAANTTISLAEMLRDLDTKEEVRQERRRSSAAVINDEKERGRQQNGTHAGESLPFMMTR